MMLGRPVAGDAAPTGALGQHEQSQIVVNLNYKFATVTHAIMVHWIWSIGPAWGNIAPAHAIAARLLELNSELEFTFSHALPLKAKVEADWDVYPAEIRSRVKITTYGDERFLQMPIPDWRSPIVEGVQQLVDNAAEDKQPAKIICDQVSLAWVPEALRPQLPRTEFWVHHAPSAVFLYLDLAPSPQGLSDLSQIAKQLGGDKETRVRLIKAQNGKLELDGTVVEVPGAQPIYDWERALDNLPFPEDLAPIWMQSTAAYSKVDGVLVSSSPSVEPEAFEACKKLRRIVAGGQSLSPRAWSNTPLAPGALKSWLDAQPEDSTIAICFGSMVFPVPDEADILIDVLNASQRPYVVCAQAEGLDPTLSEEGRAKVRQSKHGYLVEEWADNIGIFNHAAVRAVMWHGGWNTFGEVVLAGKILISWPLAPGDEPVNSSWASLRNDPVAFELLQVRHPRRPAKRGVEVIGTPEAIRSEMVGVFKEVFQAEGDRIRENIVRMAEGMRRDREGVDREALSQLARS